MRQPQAGSKGAIHRHANVHQNMYDHSRFGQRWTATLQAVAAGISSKVRVKQRTPQRIRCDDFEGALRGTVRPPPARRGDGKRRKSFAAVAGRGRLSPFTLPFLLRSGKSDILIQKI